MKKIKVCILGSGFSKISYLPAFAEQKDIIISSIFGRNLKMLKKISKKYKIKNIYTNFDHLIKNCEDDFYCNVLPPKEQFTFSKKILSIKKKSILCEKPFTTSLREASFLEKLVLKNKLKCFVNYQMRYQPLRYKIKKIIERKKLGKILNVNLSYDFSSRLYEDIKHNWWSNVNLGGGVLNAMGSHQIDLLVWLFGKVEKVFGTQNTFKKFRLDNKKVKKKVTSDDISNFILFFKNFTANVSISSISVGWRTSHMEIYGDKGALFLNGENELKFVKKTKFNRQENSKEISLLEKDNYFNKKWVENSIWRAAFLRQVKYLIKFIKNKNSKYHGANSKDAIYVRKIIQKIQQSSKKGSILKV